MVDGLLGDAHRRRSQRNAACSEQFESGLEIFELKSGARMQLGLVGALFLEFVGDSYDIDSERHGTRGQYVHYSIIDELDAELHALE